jgi:alpha-galactosidase
MKRIIFNLIILILVAFTRVSAQTNPDYWQFTPKPLLGWNSWDIFGTTVTDQQVKEQADAMAKYLLPSGYKYLTVDIQWYEPESKGHGYDPNSSLTMDEYGRLTPGLKKFPSAANGKGFKPLADYVHSKGLKFGIHIMRGIPRQAEKKTHLYLAQT